MAAKTVETWVQAWEASFQVDNLGYVRCGEHPAEGQENKVKVVKEMRRKTLARGLDSYGVLLEPCKVCGKRIWSTRKPVMGVAIVEYHGVKIF